VAEAKGITVGTAERHYPTEVKRVREAVADAPPEERATKARTVAKQLEAPPTDQPRMTDLTGALVRVAGAMGAIGGLIEDLGTKAVAEDTNAVTYMLTINHQVADTFGPFISADEVEKARAEWGAS
jgi:hypothetical protein